MSSADTFAVHMKPVTEEVHQRPLFKKSDTVHCEEGIRELAYPTGDSPLCMAIMSATANL